MCRSSNEILVSELSEQSNKIPDISFPFDILKSRYQYLGSAEH